ncbi:unnamed protein product [Orchesella dallaii]|uniref:Protein ECT2 n=1 Tax=Orchesella dallaii TaxID=48710 RepID=A0ABP1QTG1_9HEXA
MEPSDGDCTDDAVSIDPASGTKLFSPLSICSVSSPQKTPGPTYYQMKPKFAYLSGTQLWTNSVFMAALKTLELEPRTFDDAFSNGTIDHMSSVFIFEEFSGAIFEALRKRQGSIKPRIYGPPVIILAVSSNDKSLPVSRTGYPIFSRHLKDTRVAVTGLKTKEHFNEVRRKILYMDGTFLEREGPLTHLIAGKCRGTKYRDAVALGKPILNPDWIEFVWNNRHNPSFLMMKDYNRFKVKAFYGSKIFLDGFDSAEKSNMDKLIEENGGETASVVDSSVTHIVLNDLNENSLEAGDMKLYPVERAKIVKAEWFWSSIQIEACADESSYLYDCRQNDEINNSIGTPSSFTSPTGLGLSFSDADGTTPKSGTPGSASRRKRKRMRDLVTLAQVEFPPYVVVDDDPEKLNLGGKSLDQCQDVVSDVEYAAILKRINAVLSSADLKTMSRRQIEFHHLIETERNYTSILMMIVKHFKEPCEKDDQAGGRILDTQEVKTIFGPILPIFSLHRRMLRDLFLLLEKWNEENLIGEIYVKYAKDLRKSYEPFINFFESVKNEIVRCETEKPRFMAFLKIAQCKPDCGKQTLADLMIRPVQRLPSTALILTNLARHTPKTNPDSEWISKGLEAINQVNQTINEEKKRNDARVAMFDTFHEIEGCPVELLSDHRTLLHKFEVTALTDMYGQKYDPLMLCVFSDHIQVVKRRSGTQSKNLPTAISVANLRSPQVSRKSYLPGQFAGPSNQKRFKFLEWICFSYIKRVVEIVDLSPPAFAFIVISPNELRERVLAFTVPEDLKWTRQSIVQLFAKQVAEAAQRMDYEHLIAKVDASSLHISENTSVLEKASRFATKTRKKVGRALSLSKTPSKLKRTVSQMMSPFGSRNCHQDSDSISQSSESSTQSASVTPLRSNLSTMSLWFSSSKRGTLDNGNTPKSRKITTDKDPKKGFSVIQES